MAISALPQGLKLAKRVHHPRLGPEPVLLVPPPHEGADVCAAHQGLADAVDAVACA